MFSRRKIIHIFYTLVVLWKVMGLPRHHPVDGVKNRLKTIHNINNN